MFRAPSSGYFRAVSLEGSFNREWGTLGGSLEASGEEQRSVFDRLAFRGIPFSLGGPGQDNVILLDEEAVSIELGGVEATYILFLHVVEDRPAELAAGLTDFQGDLPGSGHDLGNFIGGEVSGYRLEYADGGVHENPIRRRYEIQQRHISWGASPFMAVPFLKPELFPTSEESYRLNEVASYGFGEGETRCQRGSGPRIRTSQGETP